MFCGKCGSQLPENGLFCVECGEKITNNQEAAPKKKGGFSKKALIISISTLAVILLVAGVSYSLLSKGEHLEGTIVNVLELKSDDREDLAEELSKKTPDKDEIISLIDEAQADQEENRAYRYKDEDEDIEERDLAIEIKGQEYSASVTSKEMISEISSYNKDEEVKSSFELEANGSWEKVADNLYKVKTVEYYKEAYTFASEKDGKLFSTQKTGEGDVSFYDVESQRRGKTLTYLSRKNGEKGKTPVDKDVFALIIDETSYMITVHDDDRIWVEIYE